MKKGIRIIGIDDTPFRRGDKKTCLVAVVMRYGKVEDVLLSPVTVDGDDAAEQICSLLKKKYARQGKVVFIHSITLAGLNIVDIDKVSKELGCGVICITNNRIHDNSLKNALSAKFPHRIRLLKEIHKIGRYYISYAGLSYSDAVGLVRGIGYEPVRVADIIARSIGKGPVRC
ncbi:MAG: DUF99 family protein [Candidatus Micrarchaeota archaeon]|nr:DUF99 family protein [Candidatus Micrarchaeota archaeon]